MPRARTRGSTGPAATADDPSVGIGRYRGQRLEEHEMEPSKPIKVAPWRDKLHEIIFEADTKAGKAFDVILIGTILASVVAVMLSTIPEQSNDYYAALLVVEWIFTGLFTIEYIVRIIIVRRRLRYIFSFYGIVDLLSILPMFLAILLTGADTLLVIRTIRLLRIFRVFKLARYLSEASALKEALYVSRHKIAVFLTTVLITVLIASAIMHVVETEDGNEDFNSLPNAMYWAIITMSTVGYGDITPGTPVGKLTTAVLVLVGYSLIIVPTGILTAEIASRPLGRVSTISCAHCLAEGHDTDAKFCKRCGLPLHEPPDDSDQPAQPE